MKTKSLLFGLFTLTLFAIGSLVTVLFNTTPSTTDVILLFYVAYFLSVFGVVFFTLFLVSYSRNRSIPPWQSTLGNFRYAAVIGALTTILIVLNSYNLLSWPITIVVAIGLVVAELIWRRRGARA